MWLDGEQKFVELFRTTYVTVVDIWIVAVIQIQTGRVDFSSSDILRMQR